VPGKGRVLVFSMGSTTSGIPLEWGASRNQPGVNVLEDLSDETAQRVIRQIREAKRPGDVIVASIHWGGNWGYDVPDEQIRFAHRLVEGGADVVHGHSSHHVKGIEVYRGRLILYGCGDLVDDYEGISGHEEFRGDLKLLYLAQIDPRLGQLRVLRLILMQIRRFQLKRASFADTGWLRDWLSNLGAPFGTDVEKGSDNSLTLRWR
jgi:poly-gamma-glutamate capsule biosynthesis protein CapA/YwtB (metallophosphatase superfamily)